jgi:hypothetical protein
MFLILKKTMAQQENNPSSKKLLLGFAIVCTFGGVLFWWLENGRFSTSAECKAAREQHAELKVDSSIYASLYRESRQLEILKASQQIDRYCKKWPPS